MNTLSIKIVQAFILTTTWFYGSFAVAQQDDVITHSLTNYFQFAGCESYFNGRLLTDDDLTDEQQYQHQKNRFLPDVELPLVEIVTPLGMTSVTLFFHETDAVFGHPMDPTNSDRPQADDFVLLDDTSGTWRGQIYLPDFAAVYELGGTFANPVPEPSALALLAFGGSLLVRFRRLRRVGVRSP